MNQSSSTAHSYMSVIVTAIGGHIFPWHFLTNNQKIGTRQSRQRHPNSRFILVILSTLTIGISLSKQKGASQMPSRSATATKVATGQESLVYTRLCCHALNSLIMNMKTYLMNLICNLAQSISYQRHRVQSLQAFRYISYISVYPLYCPP